MDDHKKLAVLANATLLGWLVKVYCPELLEGSPFAINMGTPEGCPNPETLTKVIKVADALDVEIENALDRRNFGELTRDEARRTNLTGLYQSNAVVATASLASLGLEINGERWTSLSTLLNGLDQETMQTPIAQLVLSDVLLALREFVFEWMLTIAARKAGSTVAAARYYGVETLAWVKETSSTPSWERWNSPAERKYRAQSGWAESMLKKARVHLWAEVERFWDRQQKLGRLANKDNAGSIVKTSPKEDLTELGFLLIHEAGKSDEDLQKLFPCIGYPENQKYWMADRDPFTMCMLFAGQIGLRAVQRNWAYCIAINDGVRTQVPPESLAGIGDGKDLWLPADVSKATHMDLEDELKEANGADKLVFSAFLDSGDSAGLSQTTTPAEQASSGSVKHRYDDQWHVKEAQALISSG